MTAMTDHSSIAAQRKSGRARLADHSLTPDRDIDALLCDLTGLNRAQLYAHHRRVLTNTQIDGLDTQLRRLEQGEPLAYVRGKEDFWSLSLHVTPHVLIPRPDTELLVEVALASLADIPRARVLDLGTGSGAVALALASDRPLDAVVASDSSAAALSVARANQQRLGLANVSFVLSDWYQKIDGEPFDLIVSNPPYIDVTDPHVETSVRDYEPHEALFCGRQGLEAIATIISGSKAHLKAGGTLWFEHGWQQHEQAGALLREQGFDSVASHRDLAGHYRVTGGRVHPSSTA
jgi:release factor glutamine methyltransferase